MTDLLSDSDDDGDSLQVRERNDPTDSVVNNNIVPAPGLIEVRDQETTA
ncbi:hypothetical protein PI124_g18481 [Phytophthora idaei]|nr:hypothetical protein PI125_g21705 [Phytophthora idaei]KAG3162243.1 hypothetical protein PI126_g6058 [Phytophthora idaei]KAG3236515.1 hypothetical protein PI124_g18481 [Phytophthora idaei]